MFRDILFFFIVILLFHAYFPSFLTARVSFVEPEWPWLFLCFDLKGWLQFSKLFLFYTAYIKTSHWTMGGLQDSALLVGEKRGIPE